MAATNPARGLGTSGIKVLTGIALGGVGLAALFGTNTLLGSTPPLVLGLSAVIGFIVGVSDDIEPLGRVLERGYWVIASVAILFFLLLAAGTIDPSVAQLSGFALGFGSGGAVGTLGVVTAKAVRHGRITA